MCCAIINILSFVKSAIHEQKKQRPALDTKYVFFLTFDFPDSRTLENELPLLCYSNVLSYF